MRAAWVLLLAAWAALGYDCCNGKVCNSNWDAYDSVSVYLKHANTSTN